MAAPDPGLAPLPRVERADQSRQQPRQESETRRVRADELRPSLNSLPALRWQTQLGTPRQHHTMTINPEIRRAVKDMSMTLRLTTARQKSRNAQSRQTGQKLEFGRCSDALRDP